MDAEQLRKSLRPRLFQEGDDKYTLTEFIDHCERGHFVDSDGSGYYAMKDEYYWSLPAIPSLIRKGWFLNNFTHVAWFNK